jgi:hypothetical protein
MKNVRLIAALALAFGSLAFAQPALASEWITSNGNAVNGSVQFDWRGGSATQTLQVPDNSTLTITINNTIANCIGTCTPRPDTWSLTINGQVWSGSTIDTVTIQTVASGSVTIVATGKDEGFWGGWYGPIFSAPVITLAPVLPIGDYSIMEGGSVHVTAPVGSVIDSITAWYGNPNDATQGADWSAQYTEQLHGLAEADLNSGNYFGDPVPGVVKVLIATVHYSVAPSVDVVDSVDTADVTDVSTDSVDVIDVVIPPVVTPPVIEPQPQPQPIPLPSPAPEPQPAPSPDPEPSPEPQPSETPQTPEPTAEPTVEPSPEPSIEPVASPEPLPSLEPLPEVPSSPEPPVVETVEEKSIAVIDDLKDVAPDKMTDAQVAQLEAAVMAVFETAQQGSPEYAQALEALTVLAQADDAELPAELAAIPLLGDVAGAALEVFNAIGNIGADMSPAVRKQAEKAVVASVIVGQVASVAASAAMSASSVSTRKMK